ERSTIEPPAKLSVSCCIYGVNIKPGPQKNTYPTDRFRGRLLNINSEVMRRSSVIRKYLLSMSMAGMVILTNISAGHGQAQASSGQSSMDQEVALLRKDIRSDKKQNIAANMQLTDAEAQKLWTVYDQ